MNFGHDVLDERQGEFQILNSKNSVFYIRALGMSITKRLRFKVVANETKASKAEVTLRVLVTGLTAWVLDVHLSPEVPRAMWASPPLFGSQYVSWFKIQVLRRHISVNPGLFCFLRANPKYEVAL